MSFSTFDRLVAGTDGALWVRRISHSDSGGHRWDGFEPDGSRRATVNLPAGLDVREVGQRFFVAGTASTTSDPAPGETPIVLFDFRSERPSS
jgi:hypothetical protein